MDCRSTDCGVVHETHADQRSRLHRRFPLDSPAPYSVRSSRDKSALRSSAVVSRFDHRAFAAAEGGFVRLAGVVETKQLAWQYRDSARFLHLPLNRGNCTSQLMAYDSGHRVNERAPRVSRAARRVGAVRCDATEVDAVPQATTNVTGRLILVVYELAPKMKGCGPHCFDGVIRSGEPGSLSAVDGYDCQMIRLSAGKLLSPRGAGLGNEVFPLAKAYLGAVAFEARMLTPPWLINERRYDRELEAGGIKDTLAYFSALAVPTYRVTDNVVSDFGLTDYLDVMVALRESKAASTKTTLLHDSGMSFGYLGIRRAKTYLRATLLGAPSAVDTMTRRGPDREGHLSVGLHIRRGDFAGTTITPGKFNQQVPANWYRDALRELSRCSAMPLSVFVATDASPSELADQLEIEKASTTFLDGTSVADLAVLSACDVILPSISSFSMLAIFLGNSHYLWHRDHLADNGGWCGIWTHEFDSSDPIIVKAKAPSVLTSARGIPFASGDTLPESFIALAERNANLRDWRTDLIHYGQVRVESSKNFSK